METDESHSQSHRDRTQMVSYLEFKKEGMRDIKKEEKQVKTSFGCICAVTVS